LSSYFIVIVYFRLFEKKGSLVDDLELLITLQNSKTTAAAITEQLSVAETTEVEIDSAREVRYKVVQI
jgi:dynein heavy chain